MYDIDSKTREMLETHFTFHVPKEGQAGRYVDIRDRAKALAERVCEQCPPSLERSLALTNLEQAVLWANAAIARHE